MQRVIKFQSLSGNSVIASLILCAAILLLPKFQSLSGNSVIASYTHKWRRWPETTQGFNPFQGIRLLLPAKIVASGPPKRSAFQSLSGNSVIASQPLNQHEGGIMASFNPFQGIRLLLQPFTALGVLRTLMFQSLSGNSVIASASLTELLLAKLFAAGCERFQSCLHFLVEYHVRTLLIAMQLLEVKRIFNMREVHAVFLLHQRSQIRQ